MILNIALIIGTLFLMEGVAWFIHKYIMHGLMWSWHQSHHVHHKNLLEKNDRFALLFSLASTGLIVAGALYKQLEFLFFIGLGIGLYGILYFVFHDVIVHRRIKIRFTARHPYLQRIIRAHYIHHKNHHKTGGEAFGFLYAPKKYEVAEVKDKPLEN